MKRLASHFLILSPSNIVQRGIAEIKENQLVRLSSLEEEIESTSWFTGIIILSLNKINCSEVNIAIKNGVGEKVTTFIGSYLSEVEIGDLVHIYNISSVNLETLTILESTKITELFY